MVIRQKYSYFLHVPHLADSRVRLLARSTATEAARRVHACDTAIVDRYENFAVYVRQRRSRRPDRFGVPSPGHFAKL